MVLITLTTLAMAPLVLTGVKVVMALAQVSATLESRSFKSLHKAVDNTRKLQDEISSNPDLVNFVKQYLQINIDNRDFFTGKLKDFLRKAGEADHLLNDAAKLFEEGHNYPAVLQKLREFKEVGNPFTKEFIEEFNLVGERLNSSLNALRQLKEKLDQKILSVEAWRMACRIAFSLAFTAMSICSMMLSVVGPILDMAAKLVLEQLEEWGDWMWDEVHSALKRKKEVIQKLEKGTRSALDEFNCIRDLLQELETKIKSRIHAAELAIEEEEEPALKAAMHEIKHNAKRVQDLENQVDRHAAELNKAISKLQKTLTDSIYKKGRRRAISYN